MGPDGMGWNGFAATRGASDDLVATGRARAVSSWPEPPFLRACGIMISRRSESSEDAGP